jgi:hypothetical protein
MMEDLKRLLNVARLREATIHRQRGDEWEDAEDGIKCETVPLENLKITRKVLSKKVWTM